MILGLWWAPPSYHHHDITLTGKHRLQTSKARLTAKAEGEAKISPPHAANVPRLKDPRLRNVLKKYDLNDVQHDHKLNIIYGIRQNYGKKKTFNLDRRRLRPIFP